MGYDELEKLIRGNRKMTIESYNYNEEPSGRSETLVNVLDRLERTKKQLAIAVEENKLLKRKLAIAIQTMDMETLKYIKELEKCEK